MRDSEIKKVLLRYQKELMSYPNVVGVCVARKVVRGKRTREKAIQVLVREKVPEKYLRPAHVLPKRVEEVQTDVLEVGEIRALGLSVRPYLERKRKYRPVVGGVSCGNPYITAGTLGGFVEKGGKTYILSNWHVLGDGAKKGDPILQPGRYDSGTLADEVAVLSEKIDVRTRRGLLSLILRRKVENRIDASIAEMVTEYDPKILEIGYLTSDPVRARIGDKVRKSGRTTGYTEGEVLSDSATVRVSYDDGTALFTEQIMTSPILKPGDSGSWLVRGKSVCGLCFAGSDRVGLANHVSDVFTAFKIERVATGADVPKRRRVDLRFCPE